MTSAQEKIVGFWLTDDPTKYGFATALWTGPRLAALIEQECGIRFHPDYLVTWLLQRGFTPQKPQRVHRERHNEAIAEWLTGDWPRIKKGAAPRRRGAYLALMDESGLLTAPLVRRNWAPRGHPPQLEVKGGHREKVSVAAMLLLTPSRNRLGLAYQTLVNAYFTNVEVAELAQAAVSGLAGPVIMLWDGGTMHKG